MVRQVIEVSWQPSCISQVGQGDQVYLQVGSGQEGGPEMRWRDFQDGGRDHSPRFAGAPGSWVWLYQGHRRELFHKEWILPAPLEQGTGPPGASKKEQSLMNLPQGSDLQHL